MAWSVPCPDCRTLNEPDGSGSVLCASCGRFYKVPAPGASTGPEVGAAVAMAMGIEPTNPGQVPPSLLRAATYGGMGEIEAHLGELGIPFQRVSEGVLQVVRQIGPQTVHV